MYLDSSMKIRLNVAANNKTKQIIITLSMFASPLGNVALAAKKKKNLFTKTDTEQSVQNIHN